MGIQAELWRSAGHEVRFLLGDREWWAADVAIVHVDLTVVPGSYIRFARRYPVVLNDRISDIRKTRVTANFVDARSTYDGPVIVKADLNSSGLPEEKFYRRSQAYRWRRRLSLQRGPEVPIEFVKDYSVHDSYAAIPPERLRRKGAVVQQFIPEREGDWYFVRRCFKLGARSSQATAWRMPSRSWMPQPLRRPSNGSTISLRSSRSPVSEVSTTASSTTCSTMTES